MGKKIRVPTPRLADILPGVLGDSIAQEVPMRVGNPNDGRTVYVDDNRGLVFVYPNGQNPQGVYIAKNGIPSVNLRYGAEVMVKKSGINERIITRLNTSVIDQYLGSEPINPPEPIYINDLYYWTIQPTSPPSMYVYITEGGYTYNGTDKWRKGELSPDFSATPAKAGGGTIAIPTTPNSAQWVTVQLDPSDGTLSYKQGSVVDARVPYEAIRDSATYHPNVDSGHQYIGAIRLQTGITAITQSHIKNAPTFLGSDTGSFAGLSDVTITSPSAGDIAYYNGSAWVNLGAGTDDQVLTLASGLPSWADASGGGGAGVNGGFSLTASATTASASETSYFTSYSEIFDNGGYYSSGNTITIPSGKQGYYLITGYCNYSSASSSYDAFNLVIDLNSGDIEGEVHYITTPNYDGTFSFAFATYEMSASDTIQVAYQINGDSSGSSMSLFVQGLLVNSTA